MPSTIFERWSWLVEEVKGKPELFQNIKLAPPDEYRQFFHLIEECNGLRLFEYERYPTGNRFVRNDMTGLVGLTTLDFTDSKLTLVEGVSDFITARLFIGGNVLGKTTPHLSKRKLNFIKTMFESVTVLFDNDNTGKTNTYLVSSALRKTGLKVDIQVVDSQFKDITEQTFALKKK